jgi:hypothetical protein
MTSQNDMFIIGSPFNMAQGAANSWVISYPGASVISAPTCAIYQLGNSVDQTATLLTGSASTNGTSTVTTPVVHGLSGGETYRLAITATVDGRTDVKLMEIKCRFPWGE